MMGGMKRKRPRIGIALDSGGAKGGAHFGVMEVLRENNIPVDIIVGSSAGAFAGAVYATGASDRFLDIVRDLTWRESLSYYVDPVFPLSGLLAGKRARAFIQDILGDTQIEALPMTFAAVATDLLTGETVPIDRGPLVDAVMASVSMPGIFRPVIHMERLLTDGGVTDPLPLDILKRYAPDITIAVNLHPRLPDRYDTRQKKAIIREEKNQQAQDEDLPTWMIDRMMKLIQGQKLLDGVVPRAKNLLKKWTPDTIKEIDLVTSVQEQLAASKDKVMSLLENSFLPKHDEQFMNIFEILVTSTNIQQYQKNRLMLAHESPDILIEPEVNDIGSLDFVRVHEAIAEGREKALLALPQLKDILRTKGGA